MENSSEQNTPLIQWRLHEWFPDIDIETHARLKVFHDELIRGNRVLSLVGPKTVFQADAIHFADSILGYRTIKQSDPNLKEIHVVGTGNGFPGIVIGILDPNIKINIIESDGRKVEFLKSAIEAIGAKNIDIISKPLEKIEDNSIRVLVGRGFGSLSRGLLLARKIVEKGGVFYHYKGEEWGVEVSDIPTQLCSLWSPSLVGDYKLPVGNFKFSIVKTDKIA